MKNKKKKFTFIDLEKKIIELVEKNPDNKYKHSDSDSTCYYTKGTCTNNTVGCIFGQALISLGVSEEFLNAIDNRTSSSCIANVLKELKIRTNRYELAWCGELQDSQDNGESWKICLRRANCRREQSMLDI